MQGRLRVSVATVSVMALLVVPASAQAGFTISDATASGEGNDRGPTHTVTFTIEASGSGTVNFDTLGGSATAGADFEPKSVSSAELFFAGAGTKQVSVRVYGDAIYEGTEQFRAVLSNAVGLNIDDGEGIGTIQDDDPAPVLSVDDIRIDEANAGETSTGFFTVSLTGATERAATFTYDTPGGGSATVGTDYRAAGGSASVPPGGTVRIPVTVLGDAADEPNETFVLRLSSAERATLGNANGTGTIVDNDPAVPVQPPPVTPSTPPGIAPAGSAFVASGVVPSGQRFSIVRRRGLAVQVHCTGACRFAVRLILNGRAARRAGLSRGTAITVGNSEARLTRSGRRVIRVKLTKRARSRLRRLSTIVLRIEITAVEEDSDAVRIVRRRTGLRR